MLYEIDVTFLRIATTETLERVVIVFKQEAGSRSQALERLFSSDEYIRKSSWYLSYDDYDIRELK
jgi:hypothetical protein